MHSHQFSKAFEYEWYHGQFASNSKNLQILIEHLRQRLILHSAGTLNLCQYVT